jgi:DoxX-like protein
MGTNSTGRVSAMTGKALTLVFSAMMAFSGVLFLVKPRQVLAMLHELGYPDYLGSILGIAKLLGVAALLLPVPRTVREWAYAGFTFNLLGALASHLSAPGGAAHAVQPVIPLLLLVGSYFLHHRPSEARLSERLGVAT